MLDLDKVKNYTENKKRSRLLTLLYAQLLLVLFMLLIRILFHVIFFEETSTHDLWKSYLYGLIFDLRIATLILAPTILFVMLPMTFTAQSITGRVLVVLQSLLFIVYSIICAADFGHYHLTKLRINSMILNFSGKNEILTKIWNENPIFLVVILAIVLTLVLSFCLEYIKRKNFYKGQYGLIYFPYRLERLIWIILLLPILYGSFNKEPLNRKKILSNNESFFVQQLSLNPLMNIIEDIYEKKSKY